MAGEKFLKFVSGRWREVISVQTGQSGSENKIPSLDSTGRVALNMMPVGIGPETKVGTALEALVAGNFVNLYLAGGVLKVRKAIADAEGKEADGFVLEGYDADDEDVVVYLDGLNTQLSTLTIGAIYYLSASAAGAATTVAPTADGNVVQKLGKATAQTEIDFWPGEPVTISNP